MPNSFTVQYIRQVKIYENRDAYPDDPTGVFSGEGNFLRMASDAWLSDPLRYVIEYHSGTEAIVAISRNNLLSAVVYCVSYDKGLAIDTAAPGIAVDQGNVPRTALLVERLAIILI